jgi:hypothetical protein
VGLMGYTFMSEIKGYRDNTKVEIEWRGGRISLTNCRLREGGKIDTYEEIELDEEKANEFIESFVAACDCANIKLVNVGYK